jgi:hypothetical protein
MFDIQLKKTRLLVLLLITSVISACGILGKKYPEMHGRVLHEIHDKPLSHTVIVALWKGIQENTDSKKSICYHVEFTISDDTGFFSIPDWREPGSFRSLKNKTVHVYAYRRYYRTSELTSEILTRKNYIYYLAKPRRNENEKQAREARLRYLQQLIGSTTCDLKGRSKENLKPMYTAIVAEAKKLVVSNNDRKIVQKLESWLTYINRNDK